MGFFTNVINYIKSIDIKKYVKKVIPSKENFEKLANKFRRKPNPERTPDAEYGFTSESPTRNHRNIQSPTENPEPIYLQVMERKSVVGIVEPRSRIEDTETYEEVDGKIGRPSIYTDRTQLGINKLMNHLHDKQRHSMALMPEQKRQAPKKPKRISHETDDLKTYILDSINEIEMIRHQIYMKSEIVKTVECDETDLKMLREYLTSCMIEIEDIDAKGTGEIASAKEDALYYAKQWYNQLGVQLEAAEDIYVRATLAQLDAVKEKLNKLSSEAKTKEADKTDVIRRLSQYIDDIKNVDSKTITEIETVKRSTIQLLNDLHDDIRHDFANKPVQNANEHHYNTQIGEEDIYDEVSISSSSENVSIVISDSSSEDESIGRHTPTYDTTIDNRQVRRPSHFIVPDILIDNSEVVEEVVENNIERKRLSVVHLNLPNNESKIAVVNTSKGETSNPTLKDNQLKFVAVNFANLDSSESEDEIKNHKTAKLKPISELNTSSSSSSSSIPEVHQELQQAKRIIRTASNESPRPNHKPQRKRTPSKKKPPTLAISHQVTIPPVRLSKEDLEFGYTQECLQEILLCRNRLECLADSVQRFRGTSSDDEFVFLQENITFSMMALNAIDAKNIKAVQDMKREAMMYGQIWYDDLEFKAQEVVTR